MLGQINLTKTNIRAINFVNELEIEKKRNLSVALDTSLDFCDDKTLCKGNIDCTVKSTDNGEDSEERFELHVLIDGIFSADVELEESDELRTFVLKSMFPYLQSYVRIITSLSDLAPITLPYPGDDLFRRSEDGG